MPLASSSGSKARSLKPKGLGAGAVYELCAWKWLGQSKEQRASAFAGASVGKRGKVRGRLKPKVIGQEP